MQPCADFGVQRCRVRRLGPYEITFKSFRCILALVIASTMLSSCGTGARPVLISPETIAELPSVELSLPAAPSSVTPLPPAAADRPTEASVDDALLSWSLDRDVPYLDSCLRVETSPGQLCDTPTDNDAVRLLGPSKDEIWYVVRVQRIVTEAAGVGYRVADVQIAGR